MINLTSKKEFINTIDKFIRTSDTDWNLPLLSKEGVRSGLPHRIKRPKVSKENIKNATRELEADIEKVLKKTRSETALYIIILITTFIVAIAIVVKASIEGANPLIIAGGGISGLGVTAAWPVMQIRKINSIRFACRMVPVIIKNLTPKKAEDALFELIKVIYRGI